MNLYPPILESQALSRQKGMPTSFSIPFTMPLSTTLAEIQHVQVLIRRQANMEPWSSQARVYDVPDKETIFLPRNSITGLSATNPAADVPQALYYVNVPINDLDSRGFLAGNDDKGETYTIQIRFGRNARTYTGPGDFATWRNAQVAASAFGEWSNTQRMFIYAGTLSSMLSVTPKNSPIAGLNWSYNPVSDDPLSQVRIQYSWSTPNDDAYGNMFRAYNLDFESHDGMGSNAAGEVDMGVMRFSQVSVVLTLTTINNTVLQWISDIVAFPFVAAPAAVGGYISPVDIIGEEVDDGVLGIAFGWQQPTNAVNRQYYHNIYRVNLRTIQSVLITQIPAQGTHPAISFDTILKDYSIEMGEEYVYFAVAFNLASVFQYALVWDSTLTPAGWKPHLYSGYARQMDFQGNTFLTTKWGQLRLQGNVQVSNFQRNVSDQFTQTIGGIYPFYSRSAQFNYRTLSLQGLVSMNFDVTNTFLRFQSQLVSPSMVAAKNGVVQRYNDAIAAITNADPLRNEKREAALTSYYREMEMIYRGISPTTGAAFPDLPDRPLWMTGQLWVRYDQDNENLVLRDTELFSEYQFSNSQARIMEKGQPHNERLERLNEISGVRGPTSIYDSRLLRDATHVTESGRRSDLIYAERKFREAVMSWLSDGKPKLFRSETEGNMIVMLSGISFTPFNKSRQVYSLSCTVTEIAEYNLDNLILYGLVPVKFESYFPPASEYSVIFGENDPNL